MATHSSILAWRIPRTEEPDRFPVHVVARVRHDLVNKPSQASQKLTCPTHGKMPNMTSHQGNEIPNHNEVPLYTHQGGYYFFKVKNIKCW